jgi:hypothetical protein
MLLALLVGLGSLGLVLGFTLHIVRLSPDG